MITNEKKPNGNKKDKQNKMKGELKAEQTIRQRNEKRKPTVEETVNNSQINDKQKSIKKINKRT
jgi:hypothetical protein